MSKRECPSPRCAALNGALLGIAAALVLAPRAAPAQADRWSAVDSVLERSGARMPGGVARYGLARSDLHVTVDSIAILPAFALGGWIAFAPVGRDADMMGDLVLLESEVNGTIDRLRAGRIAVTALHNHLARETPRVMYLHVHGHGDAVALARAVRAALAPTGTPLGRPAAVTAVRLTLDTARLTRTLRFGGRAVNGVYQLGILRAAAVRVDGRSVPPALGTATAINMQPLDSTHVAITGDFVMTANEVGAVMGALRDARIDVTSLHSHMLDDVPHLYMMHFWAAGSADSLAAGLRHALDWMALAPPAR